jgi:hypothetical protein
MAFFPFLCPPLLGFLSYVKEQVAAFRDCETRHGEGPGTDGASGGDRCALLFEALGPIEEKVGAR